MRRSGKNERVTRWDSNSGPQKENSTKEIDLPLGADSDINSG